MITLDIQKLTDFNRIYQADCFPAEFSAMFGKSTGNTERYVKWLYTWLSVLDTEGKTALILEQFEQIKSTDDPVLYAIRHPHSQINERYIYVYTEDESSILLTAFKKKNTHDYEAAITRAKHIFAELEE